MPSIVGMGVGIGAGIWSTHIQDDILAHQTTLSSPQHPVKIPLKGRDFNVSRPQKLSCETADIIGNAGFIPALCFYFSGRRHEKRIRLLPLITVGDPASAEARHP